MNTFKETDGILDLSAEGWTLSADSPAQGLITLNLDAGLVVETRHAILGKMNESLALHEKRRTRSSRDGSDLFLELSCALPFGAEPAVNREILINESSMRFVTDLKLRPSYAMELLASESLFVSGAIGRIGILKAPKKGAQIRDLEWSSFDAFKGFDEAFPPLAVLFEGDGGRILEIATGEDLWRWAAAPRHNGSCRFILRKEGRGVEMLRELFTLNEGAEPPKGWNWRLTWHMAWGSLEERPPFEPASFKAVFDMGSYDWPESALCVTDGELSSTPCLCSSSADNCLKRWLRSQLSSVSEGDVLAIVNIDPGYCDSYVHPGRPPKSGALPHWGLDAILEFRRWACRQLAARGAALAIFPKEGAPAWTMPSLFS